jgi:aspartate-semialdehyde dehydrogenase
MASRTLRAAIVGASTLLGRELAEHLNDATGVAWDVTLLDGEDAIGQVAVTDDGATVIQPLAPGAFDGMDIVFFAGDAATAGTHWREARAGGAGIVDLTGELAEQTEAVVLAPAAGAATVDLTTTLVVAAHPTAVMLALLAVRLKRFGAARLVATVMEPASEQGKAGLDEMHQQTVGLLSFQAVPKDVYDMQVGFNLTARLGADAKVSLAKTAQRIGKDFSAIATGCELALQVVQAPVFNGHTASVFVSLADTPTEQDVREALHGSVVNTLSVDDPGPSNLTASGQKQVLATVRKDAVAVDGFWLWMASDNLIQAAQNAIACAMELVRLRPDGKVQ